MVQAHPAPPRMKVVQSAGAVVWRFRDGSGQSYRRIPKSREEIEVLLVHRPRYNDWSWPKGKKEIREPLPTCAVREVEEETGYTVRLGAPLTTQRYRLGLGATKEVHYWVGFLDIADSATLARPATNLAPVTEIDKSEWVGVEEARRRLARKGDKRLLEELLVRLDRQELFTKTVLITTNADVKGVERKLDTVADRDTVEQLQPVEESSSEASITSTISEETRITVLKKPGITPAMIAKKIQRVQVRTVVAGAIPKPGPAGVTPNPGLVRSIPKPGPVTLGSGSVHADGRNNDIDGRENKPVRLTEENPNPSDSISAAVPSGSSPGKVIPEEQRNLSRAGVSEVLRLIPLLSAYGVGSLSSSSWRRSLATCVPYATLSGAEMKIRKELNPGSSTAQMDALKAVIRQALLSESADPECLCIHPESLPPVVGEMAQICPSWLVRRLPQGETAVTEGMLMVLHLSYQPETEMPLKLYDLEIHSVKV